MGVAIWPDKLRTLSHNSRTSSSRLATTVGRDCDRDNPPVVLDKREYLTYHLDEVERSLGLRRGVERPDSVDLGIEASVCRSLDEYT